MLFSSGDSPQSASSNLSGEGFDEVQPGESPLVVSAACYLPPRLVLWRNGIKHHELVLRHTCAHAAQRQRVRLLTTKSEDDHPAASSATGTHPPQSGGHD
jgi:predicted transcriptional regulator